MNWFIVIFRSTYPFTFLSIHAINFWEFDIEIPTKNLNLSTLKIVVVGFGTGGFPGGASIKNLPANAGDIRDEGSIPELGISPRGGHGNPLQYSCLQKPMDRGALWVTVHRNIKSRTRLNRFSTCASNRIICNFVLYFPSLL